MKYIALLFIPLALCSCSSMGVKPWDRDILAKKSMELEPYPADTTFDDHIYFSKESASGGRGFGGGGCGCN